MTDKATMPGEVWVKLYRSDGGTTHMDAVPFLMDDRTGYTQTSIHQALQNDYDSLAAVAQRMHDHLTGRGSTLKDRSDVIDEYNALMKGR